MTANINPRSVAAERARLAANDPAGERDAVYPLYPFPPGYPAWLLARQHAAGPEGSDAEWAATRAWGILAGWAEEKP